MHPHEPTLAFGDLATRKTEGVDISERMEDGSNATRVRTGSRKSKKRAAHCSNRILISDGSEVEINTFGSSVHSTPSMPPPSTRSSPVLTLLQSVREAEPRMTEEEMLCLALAVRSRRGSIADFSAADLVGLIRLEGRRRSAGSEGLRVHSQFSNAKSAASEGNECAICLESLSNLKVQMLACGHAFHYNCITSRYKEKLECPCCKRNVELGQDFPPLA